MGLHARAPSSLISIESKCVSSDTTYKMWDAVPLPSDDDPTAYEPMVQKLIHLDVLQPKILSQLRDIQSRVNLSVEATNEQLIKCLTCLVDGYLSVDDKNTAARIALFDQVALSRQQINSMLSELSQLHSLYALIIPACHQYALTATENFRNIRSTTTVTKVWALAPHGVWQWLGFDPAKTYQEQWMSSLESLEEIQVGIAALEKASGNLVRTNEVVHKVEAELDNLATFLEERKTNSFDSVWRKAKIVRFKNRLERRMI